MAETFVSSGNTAQVWDDQYFREYLNANWFKQFMGMGSSKMIQVRQDLTKKPGDSITFSLVNRLMGEAKSENEVLEGNEEDASIRSFLVRIREYKHATKFRKFDEQKTAFSLQIGRAHV